MECRLICTEYDAMWTDLGKKQKIGLRLSYAPLPIWGSCPARSWKKYQGLGNFLESHLANTHLIGSSAKAHNNYDDASAAERDSCQKNNRSMTFIEDKATCRAREVLRRTPYTDHPIPGEVSAPGIQNTTTMRGLVVRH